MDSLTVPGHLDSLAEVGQYVLHAAQQAGLDKKASYRLRLAVDEIMTNIIVHGYDENGLSGDVTVSATLDEQDLTVILEDSAPAFDPHSLPVPEHIDDPLHERPIGGLGIFLALRDVDEFAYEWRDGRNRNSFVMRRPVTASAE